MHEGQHFLAQLRLDEAADVVLLGLLGGEQFRSLEGRHLERFLALSGVSSGVSEDVEVVSRSGLQRRPTVNFQRVVGENQLLLEHVQGSPQV